MGQPYVGEIRMFGGNYAPQDWALCNGALLPIAENEVLFAVIGTTYGGDGQTSFGLPDLRGRVPVGQGPLPGGSTYSMGQYAGTEAVRLSAPQMPVHSHSVAAASGAANALSPAGAVLATAASAQAGVRVFETATPPNVQLTGQNTSAAGASQPHDNLQPSLAVNFIIALQGVYPSSG